MTAAAGRSAPSFAVAFGGGGARGLAHLHVIEVLDELGIRPVAIAGSSIGSIMGAGMAAGMAGREIREYTLQVLGDRGQIARRLWQLRPGNLMPAVGGVRFSQFDIERILRAFLPAAVPDTFEELKIPLKVTATDYFGHRLVVQESGELISALAASAAIPALFRPVRREGMVLIDGGVFDPVPYEELLDLADIVIAVDIVGGPEGSGIRMPTTLDLVFGSSQLMQQAIVAGKLRRQRPAIFLRPPITKFRMLDFLKIERILRESEPIRDELRRAIDHAVASFDKG